MQISVIIPTYKPQHYLWQTLESLLEQTLDPEQFEILIVLNGPRDPYITRINEFIANVDERYPEPRPDIRLLYTEIPSVSNARNRGIDAAAGSYLAFIDDDDWVSPTYLSDLLTTAGLAKLPYELSPRGSRTIVEANVLNFKNGQYAEGYLRRAYQRCSTLDRITLNAGRSLLSSSCCKLIPRTVIGDHRYVTNITHGEDALFMATISHRIRSIRLAAPEAIYYRRIHAASAQHRQRSIPRHLLNTARLLTRYTLLLLQIWRYNPKFILTRIAATLRRLIIIRPAL